MRGISAGALALAVALVAGPAPQAAASDAATLLRPAVLARAREAFARVEAVGRVRNRVLTVIDYALPSSRRRLWVLDPDTSKILFHEFVAHGKGSARPQSPERSVRFGNEVGSLRSSLGTFLTGESYTGEHGFSLRLRGLDPGVNDLAEVRRIVIHPADYVSPGFRLRSGGRLGRSWGCPALDPEIAPVIIERIQEGSVLFADGPGAPPPLQDASAAASARSSIASRP